MRETTKLLLLEWKLDHSDKDCNIWLRRKVTLNTEDQQFGSCLPQDYRGELVLVTWGFNSRHEVHLSFSDDLAYEISSLRRLKWPIYPKTISPSKKKKKPYKWRNWVDPVQVRSQGKKKISKIKNQKSKSKIKNKKMLFWSLHLCLYILIAISWSMLFLSCSQFPLVC